MGSTQANEGFNKAVASKAPKTKFYCESASLNRRVPSAVAQKNEGHMYLLKVQFNFYLECHIFSLRILFVPSYTCFKSVLHSRKESACEGSPSTESYK